MRQNVQAVDTKVSGDQPLPASVMSRVYDILSERGYDMPPIEKYQVPEHSDLVTGAAVNPSFMVDDTLVGKLVTEADFRFSVEDQLDGHFGESTGSANVTTLYQKFNMTIEQVVEDLIESGQVDEAIKQIEYHCADNVSPTEVIGYAIATYAKGWLVERILCRHDRFSKGSVSQDEGGLDVFDNKHDSWRQVKSVTCDRRVDNYLYYQFDMRGKLHFGDNISDVNSQAIDQSEKGQEIGKTLSRRSHSSYTFNGRTYRYMWW